MWSVVDKREAANYLLTFKDEQVERYPLHDSKRFGIVCYKRMYYCIFQAR